jgi:WD40 repeat protein/tRNA A-37 threonylcarbamoyl transferase component Bud32
MRAEKELPPLSIEEWEILIDFDRAWGALTEGITRPHLPSYLDRIDPLRREVVFQRLLLAERTAREKRGEMPSPDEYRQLFPDRAVAVGEVFALTLPLLGGQGGSVPPVALVRGYEVLEELGRGGMGVVYKARQLGLNRIVALKMIRSTERPGEEALRRFRAEGEAVAKLQHPSIVQIHQVGEHEGRPFFSLEYLEGGCLKEKLAGTPRPPGDAASLVHTLAQAVQFAHERGIIHRDLKPANILLTADGLPKVADFGLAKQIGNDSGQTRDGAILGTPSYMAPEQAEGRKDIGRAADVYALGAILYECLTGRPPFWGASVQDTLHQVRFKEPVPPREWNPTCPRHLETICLQCLRKEPTRRYLSAQALTEDLRRYLAGEPILARPVGPVERLAMWVGRRPSLAAALGALLIFSLIAAGTATWAVTAANYNSELEVRNTRLDEALNETEGQRSLAETRHQEAEGQRSLAETRRQEADRLRQQANHQREIARAYQYAAALGLVQRYWQEGNQFRVEKLLQGHAPVQGEKDLRNFEWHYWRQRAANLRLLRGHVGAVQSLAVSPDGAILATAGDDRTIRLWDWKNGHETKILQGHKFQPVSVSFSRDGKQLASCATTTPSGTVMKVGSEIKVWDTATGKELQGFFEPAAVAFTMAWAPDGQRLVTGGLRQNFFSWSNELVVWDLQRGKKERTLTGHRHKVIAVAFSPDGRLLASGSVPQNFQTTPGEVKLWDVETWRPKCDLSGHRMGIWCVSFSPDGRRLATGSIDTTIRLWDVESGKELKTFQGHTNPVKTVVFSPKGDRLASAAYDGTICLWDATSGKELFQLLGHKGFVTGLGFCGETNFLASSGEDGTVRIWDVERGGRPRLTRQVGKAKQYVVFDPQGRHVGCADNSLNGGVKVWDLERDKASFARTWRGMSGLGLAFSPDGRRLAVGMGELSTRTGPVYVWDLDNPDNEPVVLRGHRDAAWAVTFDPSGEHLVSGSHDKTIIVWDTRTWSQLGVLHGHQYRVFALAISPDGRQLISGAGEPTSPYRGEVFLWDGLLGRSKRVLPGALAAVPSLALAADGRLLALGSFDMDAWVYDLHTSEKPLHQFEHPRVVPAVALNPGGDRLATASYDGMIHLWDTVTGQEVLTLANSPAAHSVAFSPDGKSLASGSTDGTLRVWTAGKVQTPP